jgi:hypothetical protein
MLTVEMARVNADLQVSSITRDSATMDSCPLDNTPAPVLPVPKSPNLRSQSAHVRSPRSVASEACPRIRGSSLGFHSAP